jgi:N-methylhydantoinase B/oxoprolinase/acetone carboxylase alpha subunit
VTDANLLLGRLPATLPGGIELDSGAARRALSGLDPEAVIEVVNAEMVRALRVVSVEQGLDPRVHALVAFGGAGPLHACALAEELGMTTVLVPAAAGALSALGLVAADERRDLVRSYVLPLAQAGELPPEGEADLRYAGQSFELTVPLGPRLAERFHEAHEARYGYADPARPLELVAVRTADVRPAPPVEIRGPALAVRGPATLELEGATAWIPEGWAGETDPFGTLVLRRAGPASGVRSCIPTQSVGMQDLTPYPVELQVLGSALRAIAEEMGAVLVRSAFSANIKERRDCSTALFDERGRMVVQAEHIPVHLGAMPEAVAAVRARDPAPGEAWILNDPYSGGTHLPDLTVVTRTELGYAVTRAHHADVGGAEPGSLPSGSRTLAEEGVVIPPTRLDDDTLESLVALMRNPDERRGDLRAQLAAHRLAEQQIAELCARRGRSRVAAAMEELLAYSERVVRAGIRTLPDGRYVGSDALETNDGLLPIRAGVTIAGDSIEIDFAGTAPQHAGNLNCPLAVTRSACFYVVRCLTAPDLPASGGAFVPVAVRAPEGCLVNARPPAAVAAGNTETSSRIVDVVFAALAHAVPVPAQGQGTMNNVVLGSDRFTYYETIAGGQGACPDADGPSGVHVAMSNTLNTPIEALELAYPLRVERYELRLGSGGSGLHRGGDGVVRELRALRPCRLSLLTQRRALVPRGAHGGGDGLPGRNLLNGDVLPAFATVDLRAGDLLRIETPGGGGWGVPGGDRVSSGEAPSQLGGSR